MKKSIIQDYSGGECYLCALLEGDRGQKQTEEHHIFFGCGRRKLSERYGLKVKLCIEHHREGKDAVHQNADMRRILERIGQQAFEKEYPDKNFPEIFGKNYL